MAFAVASTVRPAAPRAATRAARRSASIVVRAEEAKKVVSETLQDAIDMTVAATPVVAPAATPVTPVPAAVKSMTFSEAMAFSAAPELINGRLAMLAVVAAIGAELATGKSVATQFACEPALILAAGGLFAWASLVPLLLKGEAVKAEYKAWGPFTASAEMINGRAAMLGLAALLIIEGVKQTALFG